MSIREKIIGTVAVIVATPIAILCIIASWSLLFYTVQELLK